MKFGSNDILDAVRNGTMQLASEIADLTDYRGGPTTTEYLLTAAIARTLLAAGHDTYVERQYRKMCNMMVRKADVDSKQSFGGQRADVCVMLNSVRAVAVIEVKIGVSTFRKVKKDLLKILNLFSSMKPPHAQSLLGFSVFQIHIKQTKDRYLLEHFRSSHAAA